LNLEVGTVIRWDNFPVPRRGGEIKARWFVYLGCTSSLTPPQICFLATTTTQLHHFCPGGRRQNHSHFKFEKRQFPEFDDDCVLDFCEQPYPLLLETLTSKQSDIKIRGRLKAETMRQLYNRFFQTKPMSAVVFRDIHASYNLAGITGLKRP
jgi:hypothetical protein